MSHAIPVGEYLFVAAGTNEAAVWGLPDAGECLKCFRTVPLEASRYYHYHSIYIQQKTLFIILLLHNGGLYNNHYTTFPVVCISTAKFYRLFPFSILSIHRQPLSPLPTLSTIALPRHPLGAVNPWFYWVLNTTIYGDHCLHRLGTLWLKFSRNLTREDLNQVISVIKHYHDSHVVYFIFYYLIRWLQVTTYALCWVEFLRQTPPMFSRQVDGFYIY